MPCRNAEMFLGLLSFDGPSRDTLCCDALYHSKGALQLDLLPSHLRILVIKANEIDWCFLKKKLCPSDNVDTHTHIHVQSSKVVYTMRTCSAWLRGASLVNFRPGLGGHTDTVDCLLFTTYKQLTLRVNERRTFTNDSILLFHITIAVPRLMSG
jgi:hypothetical protein